MKVLTVAIALVIVMAFGCAQDDSSSTSEYDTEIQRNYVDYNNGFYAG